MSRKRRLLLAATGLSPQVVTETVYALAVGKRWVPDEIRLLTTVEGAERARLSLLGGRRGWLARLREEYGLPVIRFGAEQITTLRGPGGGELGDIRSADENAAAADGLSEAVRRATAERDSEVHVSIAGGRKTMGFYLGYALSLYGREQDCLSHVLVEPPFESHPEFFYPSRSSRIIYTAPPDSRPLDTSKARVTLAEIPFVRLRGTLGERALEQGAGFRALVAAAQSGLGPRLEFELRRRKVRAGGVELELAPAELAFYALLARRAAADEAVVCCPSEGADEELGRGYLAEYRQMVSGDDGARTERALRRGMDRAFFLQRCSRLEAAIRLALGGRAGGYGVEKCGRRPATGYRLGIERSAIVFVESKGVQSPE